MIERECENCGTLFSGGTCPCHRLTAADALFVAKYVADTESVIGRRALDRLEKVMREYEEAKGNG